MNYMDKEFDFNEIGKRMPYRVPETFFEDVQAKKKNAFASVGCGGADP